MTTSLAARKEENMTVITSENTPQIAPSGSRATENNGLPFAERYDCAKLLFTSRPEPEMTEKTIDFYFDVGSPYTYLAATQLDGFSDRTGWTFRWRPFLLGAVFKSTENASSLGVPAKMRWYRDDFLRWSQHYDVAFNFPRRFPLNTLLAQRALTSCGLRHGDATVQRAAMALFEAYWVHDRDLSDAEVVIEALNAAGLKGSELLESTTIQAHKDALRSTTDEAVRRGAFGAPTFFVADTLFWGNDRLALMEAHLKRL